MKIQMQSNKSMPLSPQAASKMAQHAEMQLLRGPGRMISEAINLLIDTNKGAPLELDFDTYTLKIEKIPK